jgi:hypothetical protein
MGIVLFAEQTWRENEHVRSLDGVMEGIGFEEAEQGPEDGDEGIVEDVVLDEELSVGKEVERVEELLCEGPHYKNGGCMD